MILNSIYGRLDEFCFVCSFSNAHKIVLATVLCRDGRRTYHRLVPQLKHRRNFCFHDFVPSYDVYLPTFSCRNFHCGYFYVYWTKRLQRCVLSYSNEKDTKIHTGKGFYFQSDLFYLSYF